MPYITSQERRIDLLPASTPCDVGELNYAITMLMKSYINHKGLSYQTINDIMGAVEGTKQEFYFRIARPYENNKLSVNGDVW